MSYVPDNFDKPIPAIVRQDTDMPKNMIARRANCSAIRRRTRDCSITPMRCHQAHDVRAQPQKLGHDITILTEVVLENERVDLLGRFEACPQLRQICSYSK